MKNSFIKRAAFIVAITPNMAIAGGFYSGNELLNLCQNNNAGAGEYVAGVIDATVTAHEWQSNLQISNICMPATSRLSQAKDVVCNYIYSNPQDRHFSAASISINVLSKTFPCM